MKIYLTVTIDVEPDCSPSWQYSSPLEFKGVSVGIKDVLQPLFNNHNIIPTYLINNVVLEDEESVNVFRLLSGKFELAPHLHPDFIEPQKTHKIYAGKEGVEYCCGLDKDIEYEKLVNITKLFEDKFNIKPESFRAGRFALGPNTINSLIKLGYKVDTSVTPNVKWNCNLGDNLMDFKNYPEQPFYLSLNGIHETKVPDSILEIPVSIVKTLNFRKVNFLKPIWLRPSMNDYVDFVKLYKYILRKYSNNDVIVLNMMFHNVEVIPNLSPYTKDDEECSIFLKKMDDFFVFCKSNGIESIALKDTVNVI